MQTTLFETTTPEPEHPKTVLRDHLRALARRGVYWGTSSWKYDSWLVQQNQTSNKLYHHPYPSKKAFEDRCLEEYSQIFPLVGGDFSFYQIPTPELSAKLFSQTPGDFQFLLKATDIFTLERFPNLARFGIQAGRKNPDFLNPSKFEDTFLQGIAALERKCGLIVFEFTAFDDFIFDHSGHFLNRLELFFKTLPKSHRYGVEIRNRHLFDERLLQGYRELGVVPVLNSWTKMPPIDVQWALAEPLDFDFVCVRAMNKPGRTHSEAETLFAPYDRIRKPYLPAREALTEIQNWIISNKNKKCFLITNNHLEGCSFQTIEAIVNP